MKKDRILFFLFLLIFLVSATLLISGSSILVVSLLDVPAGTPITWLGLISLASMVYLGIRAIRHPETGIYKILNWILKLNILLAILWVPICYFLAGNLSFNFSEKATFQGGQLAMRIFWIFTYSLVATPLLLILFHYMISLFRVLWKKSQK
ncbi:hypothetical protein [Christiangramia aestuarii]|uniref:Uncharacterized protein n=1 Tax=Christiangramia aestuarii TaxID=1028746 RepID=A0A7K1LMD0_9FLAO|nr:hypothetical protein [Christiangramia aestuarii]MUP41969.1 hypothetical protein [Christiangramia aestuarii]